MSRLVVVPIVVAAALGLTACGSAAPSSAGAAGAAAVAVSSTSDACTLSATAGPAGATVFTVTNNADDPTEFYVYAADGERIVGEVENIGPATTRELTVVLNPGTYQTACKPGMTGDGIRADFVVTGTSSASS